ncbi:MAG: hypothetical protein NVSMB48_06850 [Marmoricola sp.]
MRRPSMPFMIVIALATVVGTSLSSGAAVASTPHGARVASGGTVRINHRTGLPIGTMPTRGQLSRTAQRNAASRQMSGVRTSASAGYHLSYNGGPVVSNVQVQPVQWGIGVDFLPEVSATTAPSMQTFLSALASGPYQGLLSEYSTQTQQIGSGAVSSPVVIAPSVGAPGSTVTDAQIDQELVDQIFNVPGSPLYQATPSATTLANTAYVLYFPAGVRICEDATSNACSDNAFCGYHSSFTVVDASHNPIGNVRYIVLPNPDGTWLGGCASANSKTPFTALESVASHELAETITDPEPNESTAWYDGTGTPSDPGEIGDICEAAQYPNQNTVFVAGDGRGYLLQNVWSNTQNQCVPRVAASFASAPPTFSLGSSTTFRYGASDSGGATGITYDVAYKATAWNGSWGRLTTLVSGTSQTTTSLPLHPGTEYCVVVRSHDAQGYISRWSSPRCTTAPVDDRTFSARTAGWAHTSVPGAYRGTVSRTGRAGAELEVYNATSTQLGLVVGTCSTCGTVQIWLGRTLWRTISTRSSGVHYQHLALPGTFSLRKTSITIRVASGLVIFDGLGVSRSAPSF